MNATQNMATKVEDYRTCSVWQLSTGSYGVRGYTHANGQETDATFDPTFATVEEARRAIDEFVA